MLRMLDKVLRFMPTALLLLLWLYMVVLGALVDPALCVAVVWAWFAGLMLHNVIVILTFRGDAKHAILKRIKMLEAQNEFMESLPINIRPQMHETLNGMRFIIDVDHNDVPIEIT